MITREDLEKAGYRIVFTTHCDWTMEKRVRGSSVAWEDAHLYTITVYGNEPSAWPKRKGGAYQALAKFRDNELKNFHFEVRAEIEGRELQDIENLFNSTFKWMDCQPIDTPMEGGGMITKEMLIERSYELWAEWQDRREWVFRKKVFGGVEGEGPLLYIITILGKGKAGAHLAKASFASGLVPGFRFRVAFDTEKRSFRNSKGEPLGDQIDQVESFFMSVFKLMGCAPEELVANKQAEDTES